MTTTADNRTPYARITDALQRTSMIAERAGRADSTPRENAAAEAQARINRLFSAATEEGRAVNEDDAIEAEKILAEIVAVDAGDTLYFFDSWGNLWATCAASDDGAEAFGPCGTALRIDPATVGLVVTNENATAWAAAQALGLVVRGEEGELDTLHPTFVAAFHANPGDIVVVPPPSLRQYLDGDDGSVARHAATEGARARARVEFDKQYQPRDEAGRLLAECIHCGEPLPRDGAGNLPAACPGCGATDA